MKFKLLYLSVLFCLIFWVAGCDNSESTTDNLSCSSNFSICLSENEVIGCTGGKMTIINCTDGKVCSEHNHQASCVDNVVNLCGNNFLDENEQCDTNQLDYQTCSTVKPGTEGRLLCNSECKFDVSNCEPIVIKCGNDLIDTGEQCDGTNLNGKSCSDFVASTQGTLACNKACMFDFSECKVPEVAVCGNNILDAGEQCDGTALNDKTCGDVVHGTVGDLSCDSSCNFVTSGCHVEVNTDCGNDIIEAGEQCDGKNLNRKNCGDVIAGTEGILSCTNKCVFNTTYCYVSEGKEDTGKCGNGQVDPGEQCDGSNLNGNSCKSVLPGTKGTLLCDSSCRLATYMCMVVPNTPPPPSICGNNIVEVGEQCDGTALNGATCSTLVNGTQGYLSCENCHFDTSHCQIYSAQPVCGNGYIEAGEQCDTNHFNGKTCSDVINGTEGFLSCDSQCRLVTTDCKMPEPVCGNNTLEDGEQCERYNLDNKTCADFIAGSSGTLSCNSVCQFDTSQCKMAQPVVGTLCDPLLYQDVCYQDNLYFCNPNTGIVSANLCQADGKVCRTSSAGFDTCMNVDTEHKCKYDGQPIFNNQSCGVYHLGLIIYDICTLIDNQYYTYLTLSSSVCSKDYETNNYSLVSCKPDKEEINIEQCQNGCTHVYEEGEINHGFCDNIDVPPALGSPCTKYGATICSQNNVLICDGEKYTFLKSCTEEVSCDTVTNNGEKIADCMTECDSSDADTGTYSSIDITCFSDTFGMYYCTRADSGKYKEYLVGYVYSYCFNQNYRMTCVNDYVTGEPCNNCSNLKATDSNGLYFDTTTCDYTPLCSTITNDSCDPSCMPTCSSDKQYLHTCPSGRPRMVECLNGCETNEHGTIKCEEPVD